jgi:hypothetical protein
VQAYIRVCEQGNFYESMMTAKDMARGKKYRDKFKVRFYRGVLFGPNKSKSRFPNLLKVRFRNRYPSVAQMLRELKRKNYRTSAWVMQHFEATLFIFIICGRIARERPGTVIVTIHDCLLTTPDAVEYVQSVVLDEFGKLGVHPTLHVKDLS